MLNKLTTMQNIFHLIYRVSLLYLVKLKVRVLTYVAMECNECVPLNT